ncbi:hypothetical protein Tco_0686519 [Tanacetum coccineum]
MDQSHNNQREILKTSPTISIDRLNVLIVIDVACEEDSDFLLEETDAFLAIEDESVSPEIDDSYYDSEGDILLLEEFLNADPSSQHSLHKNLKLVNQKSEKSS